MQSPEHGAVDSPTRAEHDELRALCFEQLALRFAKQAHCGNDGMGDDGHYDRRDDDEAEIRFATVTRATIAFPTTISAAAA